MELFDESQTLRQGLLAVAATDNYTQAYKIARIVSQDDEKRTEIERLRTILEKNLTSLHALESFVKSGLLFADINDARYSRQEIKKDCDEFIERIMYIAFMDLNDNAERVKI